MTRNMVRKVLPPHLDFIPSRGHRVRGLASELRVATGAAGTRTLITTAFMAVSEGRKGDLPS